MSYSADEYMDSRPDGSRDSAGAPAPFGAVPSRQQLLWQEMGMYAFIHFGINTFTGREWGDGSESEDLFQPTEMNCEQWCRILREAGFKGVVLTAKHHDGFCLWPSRFTTHSVQSSKWRGGCGDVVGDLAAAARKYGLKLGVYLSLWDRHEKTYGQGEPYNEFYLAQLRELLGAFGGENGRDIFIVWFDGACGEGPNGKRQQYDFSGIADLIHELAPEAVILGHLGEYRDIRWCGNEKGFAGSPNWATLNDYSKEPGGGLLNGHVNGKHWWPSEVDVSIRPGWFYHPEEDPLVHSLEHLLEIFYHSVGRGSCLNLNIPPDRRGLIADPDAERLHEFHLVLKRTFEHNLAAGAEVTVSSERAPDFRGDRMTDGNPETFWAVEDGVTECEAVFELGEIRRLNVVSLKEHTQLGQRVEAFSVDFRNSSGEWEKLLEDSTISFRKILRTKTVETPALRLRITRSLACPCIREFSVYYQPPILSAPSISRDPDGTIRISAPNDEVSIHYTLDGTRPTVSSPLYTGPFQIRDSAFLRAVSVLRSGCGENAFPEIRSNPEASLRFGRVLEHCRVLGADSEWDEAHSRDHAVSADDRIWMTAQSAPYPHWISIDIGEIQLIRGILFTPSVFRGACLGPIRRYRILAGDSPDRIRTPVAEGVFDNMQNNPVPQTIVFSSPIPARYFRFEALESADGGCQASAARIEIL